MKTLSLRRPVLGRRSVGLLRTYCLTITVLVSAMVLHIGKQTAVVDQARTLTELRKEKQALLNKHQLLAGRVASLERSDRIHSIASQELAMYCPSPPSTDLHSVDLVAADSTESLPHGGIAIVACGMLPR